MRNQILVGDVRETLRSVPDGSVNCCVTSPPYFNLRDYQNAGQIGLESTPDEFVAALVEVFREVRRVLRNDGTLWVNLGDSYAGSGKGQTANGCHDPKVKKTQGMILDGGNKYGMKAKDLIGIPWRVAFALQADGWYLRQDIIWSKPNPMPESVTDRCTKAHEYIFLLSKSAKYFYDADAVKEPSVRPGDVQTFGGAKARNSCIEEGDPRYRNGSEQWGRVLTGAENRNKRSVWNVSTTPYSGAHFATFPPKLIEPCILAGCPEQVCSECGAPVVPVVERESNWQERKAAGATAGNVGVAEKYQNNVHGAGMSHDLGGGMVSGIRRERSCSCLAPFQAGLVLDPFMGAGTTAMVSQRLGRDFLGCELNPEYAAMAQKRILCDAPMFNECALVGATL